MAMACGKDEPLPVPPPAAMWAAFGTSDSDIGFALRVIPGAEYEPWTFDIAGTRLQCTPKTSKAGWRFEDCAGLPFGLNGFEADIPAAEGEPMTITFDLPETDLTTKLERVPNRDEALNTSNLELLWNHQPSSDCNSHSGIWAEDGIVFAPCWSGSVEVLHGASGRLLGKADTNLAPAGDLGAALEVTARNGVLYVATTGRGVVTFDVSNPRDPKLLGQFHVDAGEGAAASVTNIHNLTLSPDGRNLFAINQSHPRTDIRIIDVTNPAKMREAGVFLPPPSRRNFGLSHDISLEERDGKLIAYYYQLSGGLHILDATDVTNVVMVASLDWPRTFSHSGWPFQANGRRYLAHADEGYDQGLTLIDVTDVAKPQIVATFKSREGISIHNLRVVDGLAFIAYYVDGLRIVDLRDPANPREIGHYDTVGPQGENGIFEGAWGVHLDSGRVYISDRNSGIYAFRFTGPP
jgi:hypothetical protein